MHALEPLDFIATSRRVLHLASRGPGRIEFLREVSRLLLDFSGCDALLLIVGAEDGASSYQWSARRVPSESFGFEPRHDSPGANPSSTAEINRVAWFDNLVTSVLHRDVGPKSRSVTPHGSYWSGDVVSDLALDQESSLLSVLAPLALRSVAVIPFDVTTTIPGLVALLSSRQHVFTAQNVELYEALAQTVGLATDDRRAQHALRERVKELSCLYAIAQLLEDSEGTIPETLAKIVQIMPPAWQFPDAVVVRIRLDDAEYSTGDMGRMIHKQEATVVVDGATRGLVEVGYVEEHPEFVEGVFLTEEEHLISAIAREVSLFVQRSEVHAEKQRLAENVRQADRLATIGHLAATVAHEINEPLGGILGFAQLAQKTPGIPERVARDLGKIVQETLHAREIVRKLMLFARQSPSTHSWVRINAIVDESLALLAAQFSEHGVKVVRDLDPTAPQVFADAVQLHQVVVNLCVNALQAMPKGGTLSLRTQGSANAIVITVEDTGTGMPPEIRERIFEPFFTTKNPEQGTGLGLSVVHGIVTSHGGTIDVDTGPGTGTRFTVRLPACQPSQNQKGQATDA